MSLPAIPSYHVPGCPSGGRVSWPLERDRAALLIHDMQHHFLRPFPQQAAPLADLLSNVVALREACVERGIPVLFSRQPGGQSISARGLLMDFWGAGISADPADTAPPDPLRPRPGDHLIDKTRYSAFHDTHLADLLSELGRDQLIICGVYAHIGVQATAADAMMRGIQPFVTSDGVADFSLEHHQQALRYIADLLGRVASTSDIIAALKPQRLVVAGAR